MAEKDYYLVEDVTSKLCEMRNSFRTHHKHLAANAVDIVLMEMKKVKAVHSGARSQMMESVAVNKEETTRIPEVVPFGEGFAIGHEILKCGKCHQRISAGDKYCRQCGRLFV